MATKQERAQSFGAVASDYDRLRPTAPEAALDWLVPAECHVALDLAAGTGLLTRALLARGVPTVVAVEPDPQMRTVLTERSPEVQVLDGTAEAIPLPAASVDAVFVSSAWHWFDQERAVPEIRRVLRPGGRLAVFWTSRDRELDWVRALDRLPDDAAEPPAAEDLHRWRREVAVVHDHYFIDIERTTFPFHRRMRLDDAVAMVATYSRVITADADYRRAVLEHARTVLVETYGPVDEIEFPMRSWCWRGSRAG